MGRTGPRSRSSRLLGEGRVAKICFQGATPVRPDREDLLRGGILPEPRRLTQAPIQEAVVGTPLSAM